MNRTEKLCAFILAGCLAGYVAWTMLRTPPPAPAPATKPVAAKVTKPVDAKQVATPSETPAVIKAAVAPETFFTLENDQLKLIFSSHGGKLVSAELKEYAAENHEDSPRAILQLKDALALASEASAICTAQPLADTEKGLTLTFAPGSTSSGVVSRVIRLEGYTLHVEDNFGDGCECAVSLGHLQLSKEPKEILSADTLSLEKSDYVTREGKLGELFGVSSGFMGCGGAPAAQGLPLEATRAVEGAQRWLVLKSRFFMVAMIPYAAGSTATITAQRDKTAPTLLVSGVSGAMTQPAASTQRYRLYVGPRLYSGLKALDCELEAVMDFGFFGWFCKLLLPILNFFYGLIPNYGVAIILLTFLVRIVFWPLTHKSTVSMKKMQAIQPALKRVQAEFKGNPQKIQAETMKLYREHHVNPMAGCLPMLVQIPIFIALFTVLRSAVELRFQGFLWISDLSQPENLFAGVFPVAINILPILTSMTMALQTHLTPGTGDPAQKKMMTWMMPIMMLFMFYSMDSALCLYWTVSQVLSIVQMLWIQRKTATPEALAKA